MFACLVVLLAISFAPAQEREIVRQSEEHFARGVELQQKGDLEGARAAYEAALKLIPRRIDALSNLGVIFAKLGQYDQAIIRYQQALTIDPKELSIRLNLGIAYYQIDKYQQALGEFEQVVKAQPDNIQARFLLGMCLFETGKLKESCAELEKVYGAQPDNTAAAYLLDDQVEKGRELIDKVFKELGSAEAHLIFGLFNLARHELPPAIEELKQA